MGRVRYRTSVGLATLAIGVAFASGFTVQAHKAVTSPYNYNEHVYPILREHCGRCHVEGGAAPMSLLTYNDASTGGAFAWAQSIREMLVSEAMPPWYADPRGPTVDHANTLTSRELDILVTWASGGAPEGDPAQQPAPVAARPRWTLGKPDLVLAMPGPHRLDEKTPQQMFDVTIPTNLSTPRWVRAADLLPGTPSMVRRAEISVVDGPVLRIWEPGEDAPAAPEGTAFELRPGASVHLRIFYKKSWHEEQDDKSDQSSVGLYFTHPPTSGAPIAAVLLAGPKTDGDAPVTFSGTMARAGRVVAVRPQLDRPYASMDVVAVTTAGARVPLLKLHAARPEWPRRYWLRKPIDVPAGTKVEVNGTPGDPDSGPLTSGVESPLEVGLDFVPE